MKVYAFYLPQFHIVEENSTWWGEGYTDWVAVKQADSYFDGHVQPRKPFNKNYYNLLEKETMEWQAELMHQYGIDGVCMYHYWFKGGRRILERPAENLLEWKDVHMPFCFYWDNSSWARSWSKIKSANEWNKKFEERNFMNDKKEVLLEQDYGNEAQWREHFEYLLPFFKDDRYIRLDNKPVFMIYKVNILYCFEDMIGKWNEWAREAGLEGIYCIGCWCRNENPKGMNAKVLQSPAMFFGAVNKQKEQKNDTICVEYDDVWQEMLQKRRDCIKTYHSGFVGYDDTPRRGQQGHVVNGQTPEKFSRYLAELLAKNEAEGNEITFINAWNEWGESMYLEPDEENGYQYLEGVLWARENYKNFISKYKERKNLFSEEALQEIEKLEKKAEKYQDLWNLTEIWLQLKERQVKIAEYLLKKDIRVIAIYGLSKLGIHLTEELRNTDVTISFGIDRNKEIKGIPFPIYSREDTLPPVDAVILTMYDGEKIKWELEERLNCRVELLKDILCDCVGSFDSIGDKDAG